MLPGVPFPQSVDPDPGRMVKSELAGEEMGRRPTSTPSCAPRPSPHSEPAPGPGCQPLPHPIREAGGQGSTGRLPLAWPCQHPPARGSRAGRVPQGSHSSEAVPETARPGCPEEPAPSPSLSLCCLSLLGKFWKGRPHTLQSPASAQHLPKGQLSQLGDLWGGRSVATAKPRAREKQKLN